MLKPNFVVLRLFKATIVQGLPWFLRERENVLVVIRDAWKGQIFLRDSILHWSLGDPVMLAAWVHVRQRLEVKYWHHAFLGTNNKSPMIMKMQGPNNIFELTTSLKSKLIDWKIRVKWAQLVTACDLQRTYKLEKDCTMWSQCLSFSIWKVHFCKFSRATMLVQ